MEQTTLSFGILNLLCLALCAGTRAWMVKGLKHATVNQSIYWTVVSLGCLRDMTCILAGLGLALGVAWLADQLNAVSVGYAAMVTFALYFSLIMLLNVTDLILFIKVNRRIDTSILTNIAPRSICGVLTRLQLAAAIGVLLFILVCSASAALQLDAYIDQDIIVAVYAALTSICFAGYAVTRTKQLTKIDVQKFATHSNDYIAERFAVFLSEDLNLIAKSVLANFLSIFKKNDIWSKFHKLTISPEEHALLRLAGLESETPAARLTFTPKRYRRIIMVNMESIALGFLAKYNPLIPKETTPFLDLMSTKFHTLENFYSSMMPTDLGLTALFCSRLEDTWFNEETRQETLFSVLDNAGYATCRLRGVSIYYGNHHKKVPAVYKAKNFIGGETLEQEFPDATRNAWGGYATKRCIRKRLRYSIKTEKAKPPCASSSKRLTRTIHTGGTKRPFSPYQLLNGAIEHFYLSTKLTRS